MSEYRNGTFRPKANFATVSNNALRDYNLSLKAKGLYSLIQSYITLPGKRLTKGFLKSKCQEKEKAFGSAWKELKDAGYLKQYRMPCGEEDHFIYEYDLLDKADKSTPALITLNKHGEPVKAKDVSLPDSQDKGQNPHPPQKGGSGNFAPEQGSSAAAGEQNSAAENSKQEDNSHAPLFVPYADGTPCEPHPVPEVEGISNIPGNKTKGSNIDFNQSVYQEETGEPSVADRQTDEIREALKEQIDYSYFEDNLPEELPGVNALLDCMVEMLVKPSTTINRVPQTRYALKRYIEKADTDIVKGFLEHMQERGMKPKNIRNISAYWKSAFINFLREDSLVLETAN